MLMPLAFLLSALTQFVLALVVAWLLGPGEFGLYALALAGAILLQNLCFEWIRLAATRHHRKGDGHFARRLRPVLIALAGAMIILACLLFFMPVPRSSLLALAPLVSLAAGFADYRAAMMRAEFESRRYASLMASRNLLAALLMPVAAISWPVAEAPLLAFLISLAAAIVIDQLIFVRGEANPGTGVADGAPALPALLRYAMPIVATNSLYLGLFLLMRGAIAASGGLAEAGRFSLAFEFGMKIFTTMGTAMDLLLFQLAVRDERVSGREAGFARLAGNRDRLLALLLPMALGLLIVLPSVEMVIAAPEFRGGFAQYLVWLLPGILLYSLVQYGAHPFLQLDLRTGILPLAACLGSLMACLVFLAMRAAGAPMPHVSGLALALGMAGILAFLAWRIGRVFLPRWGEAWRIVLALAAMAAGIAPLQAVMAPGLSALGASVMVGAMIYAVAAYFLNIGDLRAAIRHRRI